MKKLMLTLALLIVSMSAASAFAKDLCVIDNLGGHVLKFDAVKLLKGKSTALVGRLNFGNSALNTPLSGVLTLDSDNLTTRIVLTYSSVAINEIAIFTFVGDKNFNATGNYNIIGGSIMAVSWTSIACNLAAAANVSGAPVGGNSLLPQ